MLRPTKTVEQLVWRRIDVESEHWHYILELSLCLVRLKWPVQIISNIALQGLVGGRDYVCPLAPKFPGASETKMGNISIREVADEVRVKQSSPTFQPIPTLADSNDPKAKEERAGNPGSHPGGSEGWIEYIWRMMDDGLEPRNLSVIDLLTN